ncbi:MAG: hypothetical protein GY701_02630 [Sulfitobacter sp.]|nr:hypothetical protein [Sulfitobacter sp.]
MRIVVTQVDRDGLVVFSCAEGEGVGLWKGSPPAEGERIVEIEVPTVSWSDIRVADQAVGISVADPGQRAVEIVALLDDYSSDGVATLRLGGEVMLVDTMGEPPLNIVGRTIEFECSGLALYPYQL